MSFYACYIAHPLHSFGLDFADLVIIFTIHDDIIQGANKLYVYRFHSVICIRRHLLKGTRKRNLLMIMLFTAVTWSIWLTRNEMVFQDHFRSSLTSVAHRVISFMQRWRILVPKKLSLGVEELINQLRSRIRQISFANASVRSGVGCVGCSLCSGA